jgi:hypothetical protein
MSMDGMELNERNRDDRTSTNVDRHRTDKRCTEVHGQTVVDGSPSTNVCGSMALWTPQRCKAPMNSIKMADTT